MKTDFIIKAEELCKRIYNSLNPLEEMSVIFLAQENDIPSSYIDPMLYSFKYPGTLNYLEHYHAIGGTIKNRIFKNFQYVPINSDYYSCYKDERFGDDIYLEYLLRNNIYGEKIDEYGNILVPIYDHIIGSYNSSVVIEYEYPFEGIYSATIYYKDLQKYLESIKFSDIPVLHNGSLKYKNESIPFKGKQLRCLEYLLNKPNEYIKEKDLYNHIENNVDIIDSKISNDSIYREKNKDIINKIKQKLSKTNVIQKCISIRSNNGTGIFIENSSY